MSSDDDQKHAEDRATQMEASRKSLQLDEQQIIELMERLEKLMSSLRAYAEKWEPVNPDIAAEVRTQEQDVHNLHSQLARMAAMEADEQAKLIAEIIKVLDTAKHH